MASLASIFPAVQWCVGRLVGEELHKLIDSRRHPHTLVHATYDAILMLFIDTLVFYFASCSSASG